MSEQSSSGTNNLGASSASASGGSMSGTGVESLTEQGKEAAGQIQEQAGRLVDLAREQVSTRLVSQKERAAGGVDTVALVLQQVAQQFRQQDQGTVAQYVDSAANQVGELASTLREQDIDQLVRTVGQYARRQPAPFLAATFALGFLGTRFFKSSSQPEQGSQGLHGYPSSAAWADRFESGSTATGGYGSGGYGTGGYASGGSYGAGFASTGTEGDLGYGSSSLPTSGTDMAGADLIGVDVTETDLSGTGTSGTGLAGTSDTGLTDDLTSSTDRDAGARGR